MKLCICVTSTLLHSKYLVWNNEHWNNGEWTSLRGRVSIFSSCVEDTLKCIQLEQKRFNPRHKRSKVYSRGPVFRNRNHPNPLSPLHNKLTLLCQKKALPHRPHAFSCQTRLPAPLLSVLHGTAFTAACELSILATSNHIWHLKVQYVRVGHLSNSNLKQVGGQPFTWVIAKCC